MQVFKLLHLFRKSSSGNIAIIFAMLLPILLGVVGAGVDFQRLHKQNNNLQQMADTLALRGAREFLLANAIPDQIESMLLATAEQGLAKQFDVSEYKMEIVVDEENLSVSVTISEPIWPGLFMSAFTDGKDSVEVNSVGVAQGATNVCVVVLEENGDGAISADLNAKLDAEGCAIYSNSISSTGIRTTGFSKLTSQLICSAGGKQGASFSFDPAVVTDCPVYQDPLEFREPPSIGSCDENDLAIGSIPEVSESNELLVRGSSLIEDTARTPHTLDPGVYCGGLEIGSDAEVSLNSGIYIFKDGPLKVHKNAKLTAEEASLYFEGVDAVFYFGPNSVISLEAMTTGVLAGILIYEDRNSPDYRVHQILTDDARMLLGTIYLPRGILSIATLMPVAGQSAYTALVAKKLLLLGSPTLVLNTDYSLTKVPVPEGIGPVGGDVRLRR